jgi:hypothetical protein
MIHHPRPIPPPNLNKTRQTDPVSLCFGRPESGFVRSSMHELVPAPFASRSPRRRRSCGCATTLGRCDTVGNLGERGAASLPTRTAASGHTARFDGQSALCAPQPSPGTSDSRAATGHADGFPALGGSAHGPPRLPPPVLGEGQDRVTASGRPSQRGCRRRRPRPGASLQPVGRQAGRPGRPPPSGQPTVSATGFPSRPDLDLERVSSRVPPPGRGRPGLSPSYRRARVGRT